MHILEFSFAVFSELSEIFKCNTYCKKEIYINILTDALLHVTYLP